MKTLLVAILFAPFFGFAQKAEINVLYEKLGIKSLTSEIISETERVYTVSSDSIRINSCGTTLNDLKIIFEKTESGVSVSFGDNYKLLKNDKEQLIFIEKGNETIVDVKAEVALEKDNSVRFIVMAIFLDCIEKFDLKEFSYPKDLLAAKKCGTWNVIAYGHSVQSSLLNANLQSEAFAENNSNCTQSGGASTDCFFSQHVCFTTFTYYCRCSGYIPFLGIGW